MFNDHEHLSMKEWVDQAWVRRNWSGRLFQSPGPKSTKPQDPHHPGHLGKIKTSYILMSAVGGITKCVPGSICGISCNIRRPNNNQNQILFCLWFNIQLYKYGPTETYSETLVIAQDTVMSGLGQSMHYQKKPFWYEKGEKLEAVDGSP